MNPEQQVLGLFPNEDLAAAAVEKLANTSWRVIGVNTPFKSEKIGHALAAKKSGVGYFTLAGGILGFMTGMGLSIYTALEWSLIVSGKHPVSLIPYFIVGFEFTVLFAIFGTVLGLLTQTRLPAFTGFRTYDERCSGSHFGIVASCPEGQQGALMAFFQEKGGESKLL